MGPLCDLLRQKLLTMTRVSGQIMEVHWGGGAVGMGRPPETTETETETGLLEPRLWATSGAAGPGGRWDDVLRLLVLL